jgi:hypothetical protein
VEHRRAAADHEEHRDRSPVYWQPGPQRLAYVQQNEVNIFENGFLQEFKNAQQNLAISQAAGVANFANRGLPSVPLPIFEAAFGARGSQPALSAGRDSQTAPS